MVFTKEIIQMAKEKVLNLVNSLEIINENYEIPEISEGPRMMGSCVWRGGGTATLFPTLLMEWKPVQLLGKAAGHGLLKLNTTGAADLAAPSLQMQSHTHHRMDTGWFPAALFMITTNRKLKKVHL